MSLTRRVRLGCDEVWPVLRVEDSPVNGGFDGWPVPEEILREREALLRRIEFVNKEIVREALSQGMSAERVYAMTEEWGWNI